MKAVITIDGLAGSGKSTVACKLARRLAFIHLNSGALFRAVALCASRDGVDVADNSGVAGVAKGMVFSFALQGENETKLYVNDRDVSEEIRSEEAGRLASQIGILPGVRDVLLAVQRRVAEEFPVVVEGRDAGTVVFPAADRKYYLDAPLEVRATRRLKDERLRLAAQGDDPDSVTLADIENDLRSRDYRDTTREIAPGVKADDAVLVDTSGLSVDEVVEKLFVDVLRLRQ